MNFRCFRVIVRVKRLLVIWIQSVILFNGTYLNASGLKLWAEE